MSTEAEEIERAREDARREYAAMDDRHLNSCIWVDPGRQAGTACFGGTRIPVDPFMAIVEEAGEDAAKAFWPSVTDAHIAAGLAWRKRYREMRGDAPHRTENGHMSVVMMLAIVEGVTLLGIPLGAIAGHFIINRRRTP